MFVSSTVLGSSLSVSVPADPPPTTTRLRALVGRVDSSADQGGWNAQKTQEQSQVQQFGRDDAQEEVFSTAGVSPSPVERALETQWAHGRDSFQAVFFPPALIMRSTPDLQRKLDMSRQREHLTVFLLPTFVELKCELLPITSTCSTDSDMAIVQEGRARAMLLETRRKGSAASFNIEHFTDLLWCRRTKRREMTLSLLANEPLMGRIRHVLLPPGWSTPIFPRFEGKGDLDLHLLEFPTLMAPNDSEDQLARIFKQSQKGKALRWYYHLDPGSIDSFETLSQEFLSRYSFNRTQPKKLDSLFGIRMGRTEMLKDFMMHFRDEVAEIEGVAQNKKIICMAFGRVLVEGYPLREGIFCRPARSLDDLYRRIEKRIRIEEDASSLERVAVVVESSIQDGRLLWRDKASATIPSFRVNHEEIFETIKDEPYFRSLNSGAVRQEGADN